MIRTIQRMIERYQRDRYLARGTRAGKAHRKAQILRLKLKEVRQAKNKQKHIKHR